MKNKLQRMERKGYKICVHFLNTQIVTKLLGVTEYRRYRRFNLTQYQETHENNEEQD